MRGSTVRRETDIEREDEFRERERERGERGVGKQKARRLG
jgi:hypothetical protein